MGSFDNKVAVVTGAARGIGQAYATALLAEGSKVVLADINYQAACEVAKEISPNEGDAHAIEVDISDQDSTLRLAAEVEERYGKCDILVNNAALYGDLVRTPQLTVDIKYWRKVFSVNLDGALLMTQAIAPMMIQNGWGRIVNQASAGTFYGTAGHYAVSKLAVVALTRGFAKELGPHGITVNAIAPGVIWTEATKKSIPSERVEEVVSQQSLKHRAQPDVLLGTLLHICSEGASWVTGQTFIVDGGAAQRI